MSDYYKKYVKYKTKYLQNKYIYTGGGATGVTGGAIGGSSTQGGPIRGHTGNWNEPSYRSDPYPKNHTGRGQNKLQPHSEATEWPLVLMVHGKMTKIGVDSVNISEDDKRDSGVFTIDILNNSGTKEELESKINKFYEQLVPCACYEKNIEDTGAHTLHEMKLLPDLRKENQNKTAQTDNYPGDSSKILLINALAIYCYDFLESVENLNTGINQTCHDNENRIKNIIPYIKKFLGHYTIESDHCIISRHELIKIIKKGQAEHAETIFIDPVQFIINYRNPCKSKGSIIIFTTKLLNEEADTQEV